MCITATNEHTTEDAEFQKRIGKIEKNEKGRRAFLKGYFAIDWHLSLLGHQPREWAWSTDTFKEPKEVKKNVLQAVSFAKKNLFVLQKLSELPDKSSLEYHPPQNILKGIEHLRQKSNNLWTSGEKMCIDAGRVTCKSKRNQFKIRNPDKPVRMGWTINKLAEVGGKGGNFVSNHLVKVGKATYTDVSKGKTHNMVKLLLTDVIREGKLVVMNSGFPTLYLLRDEKDDRNTSIIATQAGNTAHLPAQHSMLKSRCKKCCNGFSETLHNEDLMVTYWNDNNSVVFLDSDQESGPENWDFIETQDKKNRIKVYAPKVARLYWSMNGWVDRSNQACSYYSTEYWTRRKQNRVLDSI